MNNKKVIFVIKGMNGGGAERVVSLLSNSLVQRGYVVKILLTHQYKKETKLENINPNIEFIWILEKINTDKRFTKALLMTKLLIEKKVIQLFRNFDENKFIINKYRIRNYEKYVFMKKFFRRNSYSTVISFIYDSIFLSLVAINDSNKLIISERGDPSQYICGKTNSAFIKSRFSDANCMVLQSPDVKEWYNKNTSVEGTVIFNPIKSDLPELFTGERKKIVVNFCRLSKEKNLPLLINAFDKFSKDFPDYILKIYGEGEEKEMLLKMISDKGLQNKVFIKDFSDDIHEKIIDVAMFVSSSDHEGMSNSMLEAMGMGIPSICTDCPAGGARAIIKDHENGILVPVRDSESMYKAMKEIAEDKELAKKLSVNGAKLRNDLALDKIINQWMEIIE